jgi:hypothetical protein
MGISSVGVMGSFDSSLVAAETVREESRDASDRRHTDASEIVNLSIGQTLLEILDDLPSVDEGLEFCRRAQVFEEIPSLLDTLEAHDSLEESVFRPGLLALGLVAVWFHDCISVLTRYYTNTL